MRSYGGRVRRTGGEAAGELMAPFSWGGRPLSNPLRYAPGMKSLRVAPPAAEWNVLVYVAALWWRLALAVWAGWFTLGLACLVAG